jgi:hypothetical protein
MNDTQLSAVSGFTVTHREYGQVYFPGIVDVKGLNIDRVVQFSHRHLKVYPVDADLPPLGQGLNTACRVTLYNVASEEGTEQGAFVARLQRMCARQNTLYVTYRPSRLEWVFEVHSW